MEIKTFGDILYKLRESKKTAVICGNEQITYRELWEDGLKISRSLKSRGISKGDRVAVDTGRTLYYVRMMAGIALCGAIGVNIDRKARQSHIDRIIEDSSPAIIVDESAAGELMGGADMEQHSSVDEILRDIKGEDPYWLIYSSGSTGTPKASVLCHRTVLITCDPCTENVRTEYMASHCERILVDGSLSFLASVFFLLYALCNEKTAVFATEQEFLALSDLAGCIRRNKVDFICRPQSWLVKAIENPDYADAIRNVKMFSLGGEKNTDDTVKLLKRKAPDAAIFLSYGSSELIVVSDFEWTPGDTDILGQTIKGVTVYLLDDNGIPSETGEICVGGRTAELGSYWNDPKLTDEKYEVHPIYGRICHTGDLGRIEADGKIHILGRKDNMIKIHGVKIEPAYPERIIRGFDGIREAAVVLKTGERKVLCAYYTCIQNALDESALRQYLADELPYYMMPSFLVRLDKMPLNMSGKLDRKALAELPLEKKEYRKDGSAFSGIPELPEIEMIICRVFQKVLKLDKNRDVSANDSFFELGGDSIAAFEVVHELEKEGYTVDLKMLYAAPEPASLKEFVVPVKKFRKDNAGESLEYTDRGREETRLEIEKELARKVSAVYPVTYSVSKVLQGGSAWMMCVPFSLGLGIGREDWENILKKTAGNHQALRSEFVEKDGKYYRIVLEDKEPLCFYVDLSGQAAEGELISDKQRKYFDITQKLLYEKRTDPFADELFQAGLIRVSKERSVLLLYVSHLLFDEVGIVNLARDILAYGKGAADGGNDMDIFEKRLQRVMSEDRKRAYAYWVKVCRPDRRDIAELRMAPVRNDAASARLGLTGKNTARDKVIACCKKQGISFAAFIHVLIGRTLGRLTGKETVSFLSVCAARNQEEIRASGLFTQSVPFRYSANDSWGDIQEQLINSQTYSWLMDVPEYYEGIAKKYEDAVLLNIKDDYHEHGIEGLELLDQRRVVSSEEIAAVLDSKIQPPPHGRLRIYVNRSWPELYMIDFFTGEVAPDFAGIFRDTLDRELDLMAEENGIADGIIARTSARGTLSGNVRDIFMMCINKRKDKTLFVYPDDEGIHEITANEFGHHVRALGAYLYSEGYRNKRIAIIGRNSPEWVLAAFAILCGENTAVLIDPDLSAADAESRMCRVGVCVVIGEDDILDALNDEFKKIPFSVLHDKVREGESLPEEKQADYEDNPPAPEREAVLLFTTGTTGTAKAVVLSHRNLYCAADGMFRTILNHRSELTMMIALPLYHIGAFSGMMLLYLRFCARIVIVREYRMIISAVRQTSPGYATLVPRLADIILAWLNARKTNGDEVKNPFIEIALAGTTVSSMYREAFAGYGTNILDCYGMTEASGAIFMCGTPINGVDVKLDGGGTQGEILIKGDVVFDGYLDDEKENSEAFKDGWFCTGDIGTLGTDGLYRVSGRVKNLIILSNGENVSPEEIEDHLNSSPLIRESLVYASEDTIAADIVAETGADEEISAECLEGKWLPLIHQEIEKINSGLPPYKRVGKISLRSESLTRNELGKLIRNKS